MTASQRRAFRGEEGLALSVGAVLLVAVLTLVLGIAVDLSGQVSAQRQVSDAAAQAARAGAQQVNPDTYLSSGGNLEVATAAAQDAAVRYLRAVGMDGTTRIEGGTDLVVEARARYRPVFLSALGVTSVEVTGTSRVRVVRVLDGKEQP